MAGSSSNGVIKSSLDSCYDEIYDFLFQPKDLHDGILNNINQDLVDPFEENISDSGISFAEYSSVESVGLGQALSIKNEGRKEITDNELEMGFEMYEFDFFIEDGHYLELNDLLSPLSSSSSSPAPSSDSTSSLCMNSDYYFDSLG
ncbi:uncharacterized protein LOC124928761 isoform X2 [Impatiens glandulifera]|uniref:uncharacterized protein LOC124928761 isoform X2 n=1 Tax=Impatiens glandulifera TaxID=253017 RepID=UPI001FB15419|nr:uncharacterized protein LOC124928761 isoform X2 [Impatiens glandulifera]